MNISKWPMEKIMQLPDAAFGTKFPVIFSAMVSLGATEFFTSESSLPDKCVLHEIWLSTGGQVTTGEHGSIQASLALATGVIDSDTKFRLTEPLLPFLSDRVSSIDNFRPEFHLTRLRMPIIAQGRKVVLRAQENGGEPTIFSCGLVFSSIPNDIPDLYAGSPEDKFDEMIRLMRIGVKFPR